jgi:hypothetical protein
MAQSFYMPMRGERTAPVFDSNRARDLPKAFTELERLFRRANITDDNEKKKQVVYYTDIDTEEIWQYIPEFDEPTSTYADFKDAIMEYYPEAAEFLYTITDIDSLTDERQRLGMTTVQDLSDYHLQFMAITTWLIKKGQLCELGQKRAYIRAFPAQLLPTIVTRLQVNFPKHHPGIPYPVTEVYNTAKNILQGIQFTSQVQPISAPSEPTELPIQTENLAPVMAELTKTIIQAVKDNQQSVPTIPVQAIKTTCDITLDDRIATLEAEIFNLKKATVPKPPTVSIPNSRPTVPAQPYQSARSPAYAPPADRNFSAQYKPNKEKPAEPAYKTPVHEPTTAEDVYNQPMDSYHEMDTEVTDIQPTYTAEHPFFTVANTTDRSRSFISPELVEIFSNTPVEPIPTPPDHTHPITDNLFIFLPNITDNNDRQSTDTLLPTTKYLPANSTPAENLDSNTAEHIPPPPISPKNHLQSNVTNPDIETEHNLSVDKLQYIYLPSTTDDELSTFQHLPTDDKTTEHLPTLSNTNRPLLYPSRPANQLPRKSNAFPPEIIYTPPEITYRNPIIDTPSDIMYISLYTEADKSPD